MRSRNKCRFCSRKDHRPVQERLLKPEMGKSFHGKRNFMSRIHEALKKAEQDRSAGRVDRQLEEPSASIDSRQKVQITTKAEVILASPADPVFNAQADSHILQLEELRAKCVKTTWNPDTNFLVFSSPKDFPSG